MTNQEYLKALKKALSGLDRSSRNEVLLEIQGQINETDTIKQSLLQRFGTPQELAAQYLEGETLRTPLTRKAGGIGKSILAVIGGILLLLILLITSLVYWYSRDEFNYADENASELQETSRSWIDIPLDADPVITVEQAKAVFYWHDQPQMRWSCQGASTPIKNDEGHYELRHQNCLIYLPIQPVILQAHQTNIVLVRPQANVQLSIHQGKLRMAENGATYRYTVDGKRSHIETLQSDSSASVQISIEATESDLGMYEN